MTTRRLGVSAALVEGVLTPGDVEIEDDEITRVGLAPAAGGRLAAPGFVDLQVNGFAGVDVMGADEDGIAHVSRRLAAHGVTSWLPTLITASPAETDRALDVLAGVLAGPGDPAGSRPLGVHLEGPFLSARRLGTHAAEHRRDPDPELLRRWRDRAPVVAVTLAPELPGALDLVRDLSAAGVLVSLGHSDATAAQAHAGFAAGARTVTHLFNAMSPLHHREPGLPGAALARPDVVLQLVIDGHHLADDAVRVAWAAGRGRVVMVTDATAAAALDDGTYALAGLPVEVRGGAVRNGQGALAGSALTLDAAVRNACALGADPVEALVAVTEAPARLLGRDDIGRLRPSARADVVVLDAEDLTVVQTLLGGIPVEADLVGAAG
ncbi:N-acetylglucosamine-6-phosphate deacetylase [Nocardioides mesophilus]|uniref:N-acetylglucosamine-6-phosphate deacetylase n=1 Tax=Nocardioides mesophilus TaxID=433659 RepID=A0A7G9RGL1_9ACTN|nr:N-acetylglucosamine-6-phosphate deacetylase [Nocardioides mesophilus]QNN54736.1 N-acetylglucosamine-6-phosphate deacetylase [Nocardioides mesophilus]